MNKLFLTSTILAIVAISANADNMMGGFVYEPVAEEYMSVMEVQKANDETPVHMKGNVLENVTEEVYLFSDGTGVINIEIDDEDWNGQKITPSDTVEIMGEVDKSMWGPRMVEVDTIKLVNQ